MTLCGERYVGLNSRTEMKKNANILSRYTIWMHMCIDVIGIIALQVWPDYPNVTVDESLDWDTQVEV